MVLFRASARAAERDERYNDFLMKLETLPGIRRKAVNVVYSGPGGVTPYRVVVEALFDDRAALEAALTSQEGVEAGQLLLDFAGPDAEILFANAMEESFGDGGANQA
jgi:hypothetical protein